MIKRLMEKKIDSEISQRFLQPKNNPIFIDLTFDRLYNSLSWKGIVRTETIKKQK